MDGSGERRWSPVARRIRWDDKEIADKLTKSEKRMRAFIYASCAYHARRGQAYAKKYAKWTDRTGNARGSLTGRPYKRGNRTGFVIFGAMPYQPWLEIRFSGRYAVIAPTIHHEGPELMKTVSHMYAAVFGK